MSIKLRSLIKSENQTQNTKPLIAEGFWSKLKSLFGSKKKDEFSRLKKNRKFMSLVNGINKDWSDLAKMIERDYGTKPNFKKFTADDFR